MAEAMLYLSEGRTLKHCRGVRCLIPISRLSQKTQSEEDLMPCTDP